MELYGEYPMTYVDAQQQHVAIAYFALGQGEEWHGDDVKNRPFVCGE